MESEFTASDAAVIRRYLLGELADADRAFVEERLFSSEEFWEHVCLIEDDLVDAYVRGELRGGERARFESHFLSSPRRRERVAMAQAWHAPGRAPAKASSQSWLAGITSLFGSASNYSLGVRALAPIAAGLILLIGVMMIGFNAQLSQQRTETAILRGKLESLTSQPASKGAGPPLEEWRTDMQRQLQALAESSKTAAPLSLMLVPGAQRSAARPQILRIPSAVPSLDLILPLAEAGPYTSYRATIQTFEGAEVFGVNQVLLSKGPGEPSLHLSVPSKALKEGDYRILVSGQKAGGQVVELNDYFVFHVAHE